MDDFKRMYKDVDATIDTPVYFFWKEIHEAFPDAKVETCVFSNLLLNTYIILHQQFFYDLDRFYNQRGRFLVSELSQTNWSYGEKYNSSSNICLLAIGSKIVSINRKNEYIYFAYFVTFWKSNCFGYLLNRIL